VTDVKSTWRVPRSSEGTIPPLMRSAFGAIVKRAVKDTPGAIGGAFADSQGEMIDGFTTRDPTDWAILTAHYGVVLRLLHAGPEYFIAQHDVLSVIVHSVDGGYYALLAVIEPAPIQQALISLREAARLLRQEML